MSQEMNVELLPATAVDESLLTAEPLAEIKLGDLVVIHSRGCYRVAQVTKLGPKRVTAIYTTKGAWTEAQKLYENLRNPARIASHVAHTATSSAKNYDFHIQESDPATAKYAVVNSWTTEEQAQAERDEHLATIKAETKDEYVARHIADTKARCEADYEKAQAGPAQYVHVTTKNVKREDVFGLVKEIA